VAGLAGWARRHLCWLPHGPTDRNIEPHSKLSEQVPAKPLRASYSYLLRLHRFGLLERHNLSRRIVYRVIERGRPRILGGIPSRCRKRNDSWRAKWKEFLLPCAQIQRRAKKHGGSNSMRVECRSCANSALSSLNPTLHVMVMSLLRSVLM